MIDFEQHKNDPIFHALIELDKALIENDMPPITLNVVGGFALMLHEDRNPSEYTDIDFVGCQLSNDVKKIADVIGQQTGMVKGWLNNDLMLSGTTLEDLEFTTGPLHFESAYQMNKIQINVLDENDLLRLKLIAIDTAMVELENHTDFTRAKDLKDIQVLLDKLKLTPEQAIDQNMDYLINENTEPLIQAFIDNRGDIAKTLQNLTDKIEYDEYLKLKKKFEPGEPGDSGNANLLDERGISGMLDDLFNR